MFIYSFIYFLDIDFEMNLDVKECSLLNYKIFSIILILFNIIILYYRI